MNSIRKFKQPLLFSTLMLGCTNIYAIEPNALKAGNFDIVPILSVDFSSDDNIFHTSANEVDSEIYTISPAVQAILQGESSKIVLDAQITNGTYSSSSEDNYTDWNVGAAASMQITSRNLLDLNIGTASTHEARGTGFSEGGNLPTEPDEYDEINFGLGYEFGTSESLGRIAVNLSSYDKEYSNNRIVTIVRDREDLRLGATFFLNIFSKADVLFEYRHSDIDYVNDIISGFGTLDSKENYAYVGLAWEATASTSGSIRVGYGEKNFASAAREDADTPSWEIDLQWQPLTYSTLSFGAAKRFEEASGIGNSIEASSFNLDWQHNWSQRINTMVSLNTSDNSYSGSNREDELQSLSVQFNYSFARWLDINFNLTQEERDSGSVNYNYEQSVVSIGIEASL